MARMIDAEFLEQEISKWINRPGNGEYYCGYDNALTAVQDLVADMPTITPPNEWVIVGERLPEKKQDVLMLFGAGNMAVGWLYDIDEHTTSWCAYTDDGFYTDCDCAPTHWMPLPKPPKEELKDDSTTD